MTGHVGVCAGRCGCRVTFPVLYRTSPIPSPLSSTAVPFRVLPSTVYTPPLHVTHVVVAAVLVVVKYPPELPRLCFCHTRVWWCCQAISRTPPPEPPVSLSLFLRVFVRTLHCCWPLCVSRSCTTRGCPGPWCPGVSKTQWRTCRRCTACCSGCHNPCGPTSPACPSRGKCTARCCGAAPTRW